MLYTDKELFTQNEHFTFRLRNLFKKDKKLFYQMLDFLPMPIYINNRVSFNHMVFSDSFFSKGKEIEDLYEIGISHLPKISEPTLLNIARKKAQNFHLYNDIDATCSYLQCVSMNRKMTHYISNKCIIDKDLTINTSLFFDEKNAITKVFKNILPESNYCLEYWQRFQSLTKQEKIILKMIAKGISNIDIGNQLFITKNTVVTHRRNIYKKLNIKSIRELLKFSLVMDLL